MESVQRRSVDDGSLIAHEHPFGIFKRIDNYSSSVSQADLEDRLSVLAPPSFTNRGMIWTQLPEVTQNGEGTRDFWKAFDLGDVGDS